MIILTDEKKIHKNIFFFYVFFIDHLRLYLFINYFKKKV